MKEISKTSSLCPECKKIIPATIFERDGKVFISKNCPEHGEVEEVYWSDYDLYKKAERFAHDGKGIENPNMEKDAPICPKDCGLCKIHKSQTALANIVVTNRCDLTCWYCLPSNEEILVKDNGKVSTVKIGNFIDKWLNKNIKKIGKLGVFSEPKNIEVMTMKNGKIIWTKVNKLFRRRYNGKFIKVKTETGKEITTTIDHKFIVKSGENLLKKNANIGETAFTVGNMEAGKGIKIDILESFRNLPKNEMKHIYVRNITEYFSEIDRIDIFSEKFGFNKSLMYSWKSKNTMPLNYFYKFMKNANIKANGVKFGVDAKKYNFERELKITSDLSKLMGYFITDGHYSKQNIWFTCKDVYVRNEIETSLKKLNLTYTVIETKNKAEQINVGNKILYLIFRFVLNIPAGAHNKRLPINFGSFDEQSRIAMLEGIINGDGYVIRGERCASIGIGTVSRKLVSDTSKLLSTLGIKNRIHKMSMKNNPLSNTNTLYKLYMGGEDMISIIDKLNLKPSHLKKLENLSPRRGTKLIVNGDFILDKIKSIEEFEDKEQFVYDLEVEDNSHSFIAGDGILISNCFFYAGRMGYVYEPTLEQIKEMVKTLKAEKPVPCNAVQLTGGEPCLRKDIVDIINICKKNGVDHIQLNTNGTHISRDLELAQKVRAAGINTLYLSFDGVSAKTNPKNHWEIPGVLNNCRKTGMGAVLVPTVIKGVNDHEIGDIVRFGFRNNDVVRGVNMQPVSLVGRVSKAEREKMRITIPDLLDRLQEQTGGEIDKNDFYPVPTLTNFTRFVEALTKKAEYDLSSHFSCGMATYVFNDNGKMVPITRFVDVDGLLEYLGEKSEELEAGKSKLIVGPKMLWKLRTFIDKKKSPEGFGLAKIIYNALVKHDYKALGAFHKSSLFLGMMHFMDLYNYDIERVKRCCIHYAMTDGRIIPFCTFNVIPEWYRDESQKSQGISFEEYKKGTGKEMKDDLYKRDVKALESTELYRKTYGN